MKHVTESVLLLVLLFAPSSIAHAATYTTSLSGGNENPPNDSPGTGTATVTVDLDLATMRVQAEFSALVGEITAAHIHCCTDAPGNVSVATPTPTFPGFPSGTNSGSYDVTFDMTQESSYNAAFLTNKGDSVSGAFNALVAGFDDGRAYLNLHTTSVGSGEIRGFLSSVPEPSSTGLASFALLAASGALRRRRCMNT